MARPITLPQRLLAALVGTIALASGARAATTGDLLHPNRQKNNHSQANEDPTATAEMLRAKIRPWAQQAAPPIPETFLVEAGGQLDNQWVPIPGGKATVALKQTGGEKFAKMTLTLSSRDGQKFFCDTNFCEFLLPPQGVDQETLRCDRFCMVEWVINSRPLESRPKPMNEAKVQVPRPQPK